MKVNLKISANFNLADQVLSLFLYNQIPAYLITVYLDLILQTTIKNMIIHHVGC